MDAKLMFAIDTLNLHCRQDPRPAVRDAWNTVRAQLDALEDALSVAVDALEIHGHSKSAEKLRAHLREA